MVLWLMNIDFAGSDPGEPAVTAGPRFGRWLTLTGTWGMN